MILHMTTVHARDDSRVRFKEAATLAARCDEDVCLYVQDGLDDEVDPVSGVRVVNTGPRLRRLSRMTKGAWRMFQRVRKSRPSVVYFHDSELMPWAMLLRLLGIRVIYDVHEDTPRQVAHNSALPGWARRLVPPMVSFIEWVGGRVFNGIIGATPVIAERFPPSKTRLVRNFPIIEELATPGARAMAERPLELTYVGTITANRNVANMIEAVRRLENPQAILRLVGSFSVTRDYDAARSSPGWARVQYDGWCSRADVAKALSQARAGLVVLKPIPHEMETLPIKMFEYMAAGLPIISSDFPLWRDIIETAGCGLLVDPENPDEIAAAMQWLLDNPDEAEAMGAKGRRAVLEQYNWEREAEALLSLQQQVTQGLPQPA